MATQELPEFALVMRGYDRQQVDDYIGTLRGYVDEMTSRLDEPRTEPTPDDPLAMLGDRVAGVLREADLAAKGLLEDAERDAGRIREQAHSSSSDARQLVDAARAQADEVLGAARGEAERLLDRAREHAERQAAALLAEADREAEKDISDARAQAVEIADGARSRAEHLRQEVEDLTSRRRRAQAALQSLRDSLGRPQGDDLDETAALDLTLRGDGTDASRQRRA